LNEKINGSDHIWINIKTQWLKMNKWKYSDQIWINVKVQWPVRKLTQKQNKTKSKKKSIVNYTCPSCKLYVMPG
jgi:hypothetical protein